MFWNSPGFPFVRLLERTYPEIRAEAELLSVADFADWPLKEAYRGSWKIFCLLSRDPEWVMAPTCPENARRCPRTRAILERIPGVVRAGFSLLLPGTQIHLHADERDEDSLRCHLGLVTNPHAAMRFGAEIQRWQEGRCLMFDGASPHEAANLGDTSRLVCLVDVERASLEQEILQ